MTVVGAVLGGQIVDPSRFGLDVVYPAAMAGLAAGLISGRRELVAAVAGACLAVLLGLATATAVGVVAGGLLGPLAGLALVQSRPEDMAPGLDTAQQLLADAEAAVDPPNETGLP